jgi:hypothetical protein
MAKLLYSMKMDMLGSKIDKELPKGSVFARNQSALIHRFVTFIVYCYVNHMWYLTEELVPHALFSASVPDSVKENMVVRMMANRPDDVNKMKNKRHGTGFGKPKFPKHQQKQLMICYNSWELIPGCSLM